MTTKQERERGAKCLNGLLGLAEVLLALVCRLALFADLTQDAVVRALDLHLEARHRQIDVHERLLCMEGEWLNYWYKKID